MGLYGPHVAVQDEVLCLLHEAGFGQVVGSDSRRQFDVVEAKAVKGLPAGKPGRLDEAVPPALFPVPDFKFQESEEVFLPGVKLRSGVWT